MLVTNIFVLSGSILIVEILIILAFFKSISVDARSKKTRGEFTEKIYQWRMFLLGKAKIVFMSLQRCH